jgi:hypothetical protein
LGSNPDEVADKLYALGIKGRYAYQNNPLAKYIMTTNGVEVSVAEAVIENSKGIESSSQLGIYVDGNYTWFYLLAFPKLLPAAMFLLQFNRGQYLRVSSNRL